MTDRINLDAAEEAAVLEGEFYERTEWNNIPFDVQEQYRDSARLTILNYLTALKRV